MKIRSLIYVVGIANLIFFLATGCSVKKQVEAEIKKLDSLTIVLSTKLSELNKSDTALLTRAVIKFANYSVFIENNLTDTIGKTEANGLQQFYVSGANLKAFAVNRYSINTRANLVLDQVKKLTADVNNGLMSRDEFLKNYETESKAEMQLIQLTEQEIKNFNSNIQDFKNSIPSVETLIRSKNNGQLPSETNECVTL